MQKEILKHTKGRESHSIHRKTLSQQRCGPDRGLTSKGPCTTCAMWIEGFSRWQAFVASADECWGIFFFGRGDKSVDKESGLAARGKPWMKWHQGDSGTRINVHV